MLLHFISYWKPTLASWGCHPHGKWEESKSPPFWTTEYLSFSCIITSPFFQEESALGEALGLQSKLIVLPTCTWINFFIGVFEKSGAEAEQEEKRERMRIQPLVYYFLIPINSKVDFITICEVSWHTGCQYLIYLMDCVTCTGFQCSKLDYCYCVFHQVLNLEI